MTLPHERIRSLNKTRDFLFSLIRPSMTPRVPMSIRQEARDCLRHYPMPCDLEETMESESKETRLKAKGWRSGSAEDFLSDIEISHIENLRKTK